MRNLLIILALCMAPAGPSLADTVEHGEKRYENVIVRETSRMLYLQIPSSGNVIHLRKDLEPAPVWKPASEEVRTALEARWDATRQRQNDDSIAARKNELLQVSAKAAASESENVHTPTLQLRGDLSQRDQASAAHGERSSGRIQSIRLQDVTLAQALDAMLRPLGLDYEVRGNVVFISAPSVIRQESWADVETRVYQVASQYEALPKIILRNPFGQTAGGGFGGGFQQQGLGGGFGGGQQQGIGNVGGGFGGQQQGFGGGFGGGAGGGFGQQGGFNGGLAPDVTQVSNISDMFTNIDDRMVGESPAIIGGTSLRALRGNTRR